MARASTLAGEPALLPGLLHLLVDAARTVPEIHQRGGDLMPHMIQEVQRPQAGFAGQPGRFAGQCKRPVAHPSYKPDQGVLTPEADLIQKVTQPSHLRAVMEPLAEPLTVRFQALALGAGLFFFQLQRRSPFPGFRAETPAPRWAKAAAVPPAKPANGRCPLVDFRVVCPPGPVRSGRWPGKKATYFIIHPCLFQARQLVKFDDFFHSFVIVSQSAAMSGGRGQSTVCTPSAPGDSKVMRAQCSACRPMRARLPPYSSSPASGQPMWAKCTRS